MWRPKLLVLLVVALFLSLGAAQEGKSYGADRFDVDLAVQPGGDVLVRETVVFNFQGGPFTFVFRELPTDHTDGIVDIVASLDGRSMPTGDGLGQVEISGRNPVRITWHMEPTMDASRTFELQYRARGVVRQAESSDEFRWQALPDEYAYPIASSRITINYPEGVSPLGGPQLLAGQAQVQATGRGVLLTSGPLAANTPLVVSQHLPLGSLIGNPPGWQASQAGRTTQNESAWLWLAGGLGAFLLSLLVAVRLTGPFRSGIRRQRRPSYEPPSDLPPALGGALQVSAASAQWQHALGTLFDLANRGVLVFDELPRKWYSGADFLVRLVDRPANLRLHESALLELLFAARSGQTAAEVKLSSLNNLISSRRWKRFELTLADELLAAQLVDQKSRGRRSRWLLVLFVLILLLLIGVVPFAIFAGPVVGLWPLAIFAGLFLAGPVALILVAGLSVLTEEGRQQAAAWEAFHRYLKAVTKGQAALTQPDLFETYLPYAAAADLLHPWAKHFKKSGRTEVPAYFHALSAAGHDHMGAFVALAATSSASGGSAAGAVGAAGAAGAGAAGGGASGAG